MFDDVEDLLAKFVDELLGIDRANAFDHATAQVFLDSRPRGRGRAVEQLRAELLSELPIMHPATLRRNPLPGADRSQRPDNREEVAVAFSFDLEHGEPVFLVEEGHTLDQAGEAFHCW